LSSTGRDRVLGTGFIAPPVTPGFTESNPPLWCCLIRTFLARVPVPWRRSPWAALAARAEPAHRSGHGVAMVWPWRHPGVVPMGSDPHGNHTGSPPYPRQLTRDTEGRQEGKARNEEPSPPAALRLRAYGGRERTGQLFWLRNPRSRVCYSPLPRAHRP
jgi:hypothetical protein